MEMKRGRRLKDLLVQSAMSNAAVSTCFLIVEGKDDKGIYENIVKHYGFDHISVFRVDEFEGYNGGATGVKSAIEYLQPTFAEKPYALNKILGIIDRDSRQFRKILPQLSGLFVLPLYSIESFFVCANNLKELIVFLTNVNRSEIDADFLDDLWQKIKAKFHELYYLCLEALKNPHDGIVTFEIKRDVHVHLNRKNIEAVLCKKTALDEFANLENLNFEDLHIFCKGKWYLINFIYHTIAEVKSLANNNVTYKFKHINEANATYQIILNNPNFLDRENFAPIIAELKKLC